MVRTAARCGPAPPRNIAEGFGRYNPAEFAQFMSVAIASLDEVDTHLMVSSQGSFRQTLR